MFSENNIATNLAQTPGSLHYTAHRSNFRGTFPNFGWKRRGMYKSGICDTKPPISLKRSSLEPKLLQSVYRNSCTAYRLVTNLVTQGELWPTFPGSKIFPQRISRTFCRSVTKFGHVRGLANGNLFPEFRWILVRGPVIPCGDMHQSFTGALVKWLLTTSPRLPIVLDLFLFTRLPEVQAFCTSVPCRAAFPCDSTAFLSFCVPNFTV